MEVKLSAVGSRSEAVPRAPLASKEVKPGAFGGPKGGEAFVPWRLLANLFARRA